MRLSRFNMKNFLLAGAVLALLSATAPVQAQQQRTPYPISRPQPSLSKAGTPLPRPNVPNRRVELPRGAAYGTSYYYGYGRYYPYNPLIQNSRGDTRNRATSQGIPGYNSDRRHRSRDLTRSRR